MKKRVRRLTLELDLDLWKRASHLAVEEVKSLKQVIVDALEARLGRKEEKR